MNDVIKRGVSEHSSALAKKEYSSEELTKAYLEHIANTDSELNAFITVTAEKALDTARLSDERRSKGELLGALDGIPMALKDNICTKGTKTTCASKMLEDYIPPYTATAAERLFSAGAVMLGKLNMDEFAMGSTTETSYFGATKNPLQKALTPGGSSGGSAAAVAAYQAPYTLATDTGGSLRQPAAFCGVVGMKPTYSRVSRYGLVAFASSLDQIGPITHSVYDNALVLNAITGADSSDATVSHRTPEDFTFGIDSSVSGLTVGLPTELLGEKVSPGVRSAVMSAAKTCEALGMTVRQISIPRLKDALAAYYIISSAEASSNLARFDGIRYGTRADNCDSINDLYTRSRSDGFGDEVKRRIMLGTFALSTGHYDEYYSRAKRLCSLVSEDLQREFTKCDVILSPTAPTVAYPLGRERKSTTEVWAEDLCTVPANIAKLPALTLPFGEEDGMPVGIQLMGKAFSEALLYRVGYSIERARRTTQYEK